MKDQTLTQEAETARNTLPPPALLPTPPSPPRPAPTATPDSLVDTACALEIITGSQQPLGELVAGLQARLEHLRDPTSPEALAELQRSLPLLEALFQKFAVEAVRTRKGSVHQTLLLRAALQAQQAHARTFALFHTLSQQGKNPALPSVTLHEDDDEDIHPWQ